MSRIASGSLDGTCRVWDPHSGSCLATLYEQGGYICTVAWRPDGGYIATGCGDGVVRIWEPESNLCAMRLRGHTGSVRTLAWRCEGTLLASGSDDQQILIWDPSSGECKAALKGMEGPVLCLAWSQDGNRLVSGSGDRMVRMWDPSTSKCISTLRAHSEPVGAVSWKENAAYFATASDDLTVIVWDAATGDSIVVLSGHTNWVRAISWRPGSNQLASGSYDGSCKLWDTENGFCELTIQASSRPLVALCWRPDGNAIATACGDQRIKVWDPNTGCCMVNFQGHSAAVCTIAWKPLPATQVISMLRAGTAESDTGTPVGPVVVKTSDGTYDKYFPWEMDSTDYLRRVLLNVTATLSPIYESALAAEGLEGAVFKPDEDEKTFNPKRADCFDIVKHMKSHRQYFSAALKMSISALQDTEDWVSRSQEELMHELKDDTSVEFLERAFSNAEYLASKGGCLHAQQNLARLRMQWDAHQASKQRRRDAFMIEQFTSLSNGIAGNITEDDLQFLEKT